MALTALAAILTFTGAGAVLAMLAALLGAIIVYEGKSTWLEGLTLVGLYCILAVSFWWG